MSIVSWSKDYNINVVEIDTQHQQMLELVNKLHTLVENCGNDPDLENLQAILVELADLTRIHFSTEERLMKEYNYPGIQQHHREHTILQQYLDGLVVDVSNGKYPIFCDDYDVSTDWALIHISSFDKNLGAFLNSKGIY